MNRQEASSYKHFKVDGVKQAEQPRDIKLRLKRHQLALLSACIKVEDNDFTSLVEGSEEVMYDDLITNVGFIGDKVGSGKSYVILGIIATRRGIPPRQIYKFLSSQECPQIYFSQIQKVKPDNETNLIVVPRGIFNQWKTYIQSQTRLSAEYLGPRDRIRDLEINSDIVLISDSKYNEFARQYTGTRFSRVFYDEADSLHIPACKAIDAGFYWLISSSFPNLQFPAGSYEYVQRQPQQNQYGYYYGGYNREVTLKGVNHTGFIKRLCSSLRVSSHDETRMLYLKNTDEFVDQSTDLEEALVEKVVCKGDRILNILNGLIDDSLKQMICAGNIEEAIQHFKGEEQTEEGLIQLVTRDYRNTLGNLKLEVEYCQKRVYRTEKAKSERLEELQERIRETEQKIEMIEERIRGEELDPITYCPIEHPVITMCCKNKLDFESMGMILMEEQPKCPFCRDPISKSRVVILKAPGELPESEPEVEPEPRVRRVIKHVYNEHDKQDNLLYLVKDVIPKGRKILIFSEHSATYSFLRGHNVAIHELTGTTDRIRRIVDEYKTGTDINILFLNARNYGSGLNLENTDYIIIYHSLSSKVLEQQVIGRAQRIGRKTRLRVVKLLYPGEDPNEEQLKTRDDESTEEVDLDDEEVVVDDEETGDDGVIVDDDEVIME